MARPLRLSFENAFYHLFIKTTQPNLSQGIHYLNSSYANWFRNKHQIIGPIFQGRFKSILVDAGNYTLILSGQENRDSYFLCNRLCKDIKEDKRTGYLSPQIDRAKIEE